MTGKVRVFSPECISREFMAGQQSTFLRKSSKIEINLRSISESLRLDGRACSRLQIMIYPVDVFCNKKYENHHKQTFQLTHSHRNRVVHIDT